MTHIFQSRFTQHLSVSSPYHSFFETSVFVHSFHNNGTDDKSYTQIVFETAPAYMYALFFTYSIICLIIIFVRKRNAIGLRKDVIFNMWMFVIAYGALSIYHFLNRYAYEETLGKICYGNKEQVCPLIAVLRNMLRVTILFGYAFIACFWMDVSRQVSDHVTELTQLIEVRNKTSFFHSVRWKHIGWFLFGISELICIGVVMVPYLLHVPAITSEIAAHIGLLSLYAALDCGLSIGFIVSGARLVNSIRRNDQLSVPPLVKTIRRHIIRVGILSIIYGIYWFLLGSAQLLWRLYARIIVPKFEVLAILNFLSISIFDLIPYIFASIVLVWTNSTIRASEFVYNRTVEAPTPFGSFDETSSLINGDTLYKEK